MILVNHNLPKNSSTCIYMLCFEKGHWRLYITLKPKLKKSVLRLEVWLLDFWHIEISNKHFAFYSSISINNTIACFWFMATDEGLLPETMAKLIIYFFSLTLEFGSLVLIYSETIWVHIRTFMKLSYFQNDRSIVYNNIKI